MAEDLVQVHRQVLRNGQAQHRLDAAEVLHPARLRAFLLLGQAEVEEVARFGNAGALLHAEHGLQEMLQEGLRILLPATPELHVRPSGGHLEVSWLHLQLLRDFLWIRTSVSITVERRGELLDLNAQVRVGILGALGVGERQRLGDVLLPDLRDVEHELDDRVHVAGVAQVAQANEARACHWLELCACLRDAIVRKVLVHLQLQLRHGLVRLLQPQNVDAPMSQVLGELRVFHHAVLVGRVAVDVRSVRCDRAKLHHQRILLPGGLKVLQGAVRAAGAVPVPPAGADVSRREVQPQVLGHAGVLALPRRGITADLDAVVQLLQRLGVFGLLELLVVHPLRQVLLVAVALVLDDLSRDHHHHLGNLLVLQSQQKLAGPRKNRDAVAFLQRKLLSFRQEPARNAQSKLGRLLHVHRDVLGHFGELLEEVQARKLRIHR
mmetsp:Transcript_12904/g.47779  ORF Transcript_12904/g.47779 Transcript_12904/m.47779 type:complete len:436 (-) Transcript_12904:307-1614(-)